MRFTHHRASLFMSAALSLPLAAQAAVPVLQSVAPFSAGVRVLGEADASAVVHFQVALKLRDAAGLAKQIAAGHILSPAELEATYLPDAASHGAIVNWLRSEGLTIEKAPSHRLAISVSGRAGSVARLLNTHFSNIVSEGRIYVAADREPVVPEALAPYVLSINGLQPQQHANKVSQIRPLAAGGVPPFYPSDLLTAYSANALGTTGAGTTTAIIIDTFPLTADLTAFWTMTGVNQTLAHIKLIQTVPGTLPAPSGEESLDVEYSSSMAPASNVAVYASTDLSFAHIDTSLQTVISDLQSGVKITQVSLSLGACETGVTAGQKTTDDQYFATMTALGATVVVSSGDYGAKECGYGLFGANTPSFFSTSPNVAAIGGTTLTLNASSMITAETAWSNTGNGQSSGGGISKFFATPSYQTGLGYGMRAVPDVSAVGNPNTGVLVIAGGQSYQVGGTSVSAPVWAGLLGLVNAQRAKHGRPNLGLLSPRVYPLLKTANFRDITAGQNGGYKAGIGYDLVTGIGSPVMSTLLPTLVRQN